MEHDSAYDAAEKLGISLDLVTDAATGNADSLRQLQTELDAASKLSLAHAGSAGEVRNAVERETGAIDEAIRVADQKAAADASAAQAAKEHEKRPLGPRGAATDAEFDIDSLVDTILNFGSAELDAARRRAISRPRSTICLHRSRRTAPLDIGTDKGRANEKALDAIAQAALKTASATLTQTGSQEQATAAVQRGRDERSTRSASSASPAKRRRTTRTSSASYGQTSTPRSTPTCRRRRSPSIPTSAATRAARCS